MFTNTTHAWFKPGLFLGVSLIACNASAYGQDRNKAFDLPSQPAAMGIQEFARAADVQILAPAQDVNGQQTGAVRGNLSIQDALGQLLAGTKLMIGANDGRTIVLMRQKETAAADRASPKDIRDAALDQPPRSDRTPAAPVLTAQVDVQPQPLQSAPVRVAQVQAGQVQVAQAQVAQAQTAQVMQVPEQILITGSLIRGAEAVGVPVTTLSSDDFKETGALTIGDALINLPSIVGYPSLDLSSIGTPDDVEAHQNIAIHGIESRGSGTLFMVDSMRVPIQGTIGSVDPAIIPQLAVQRVDVLADGASATYGSDAIAGVVNIILKRNFDGAITQLRFSDSGLGDLGLSASQQFGRTWSGGDVTVTYEFFKLRSVSGTGGRSYITSNFTPWGLDDRTPILSAIPAIVSIGKTTTPAGTPASFSAAFGKSCNNCYSIPQGQNGTGLVWSNILANDAGEANEFNPLTLQSLVPDQRRSSAAITFDQNLLPGVQFYAEGFYSNFRNVFLNNGGAAPIINAYAGLAIPTSNPYYPVGAPAGLLANYNFNIIDPARSTTGNWIGRYEGGFNVDLPFEWVGQLFFSATQDHEFDNISFVNPNLVSAALGNTVPAIGQYASYTKPANVPYLNLFCDARAFNCIDPATLAYINSHTVRTENQLLQEAGANVNGPLFDLPGGEVKAAIGVDYFTNHYDYYLAHGDTSALGDVAPNPINDKASYNVWAEYAQINIPLVGEMNALPFVQALTLELSGRIDTYSTVGTTSNPKVSVNWDVGYGLRLRGSWGTSFRAPTFQNLSIAAGGFIQPINVAAGNTSNATVSCTTLNKPAAAGSVAAIVDPNCTAALQNLPGLRISGGVGMGKLLDPTRTLNPETTRNWALGFEFAPQDGWFKGLDVSVTDWFLKVYSAITTPSAGTGRLDDPVAFNDGAFIPNRAYGTAGVDPVFAAAVARILANPLTSQSINTANFAFIADGTNTNAGWVSYNGLDFSASYDVDLKDLGAWNTGVVGSYTLDQQILPGYGPGFCVRDLYKGAAAVGTCPATTSDTGGRLSYRARVGWAGGPDSAWNATLFMNAKPHVANTVVAPPCFIAGNTACNASGLPQFAQYTTQFPASFNTNEPGRYTFDLSVGYNTGDRPANAYLRGISVQFTINDILDRKPRFDYITSNVGGNSEAFDRNNDNPEQRTFILVVTKTW